ncbi:MAG: ArsR/SmtB family transcription factor [Anaerolineae bacterium]
MESMIAQLEPEVALLHSHVCEGLGDPKRVLILYLLAERPLTVAEITTALGIPQPTTSHRLKILRDRGLITLKKEGTSNYYSLADRRIIQALDLMRQMLADMLTRRASVVASLPDL